MTVRVGVIGTGLIGRDHIRRITRVLSGGAVVAVADADTKRAHEVAAGVPGCSALATGQHVIRDEQVDGVLVASWGQTHEEYVLAAIQAGKPVFCEKPLAPTPDACRRIVDAEVASGRRLLQVGFMRRYDAAYRALKDVVDGGSIGAPLLMHCAHRNPSVPPYGFTTELLISDAAAHEIDLVRWLFGEEITATRALTPCRNSRAAPDLQDPLILLLEMASGALVDVELSANVEYGYDIRGEVVAETGTAALGEGSPVLVKQGGRRSGRVPAGWGERFAAAYDTELQDWLDAVTTGGSTGPSAWDGYAAAAVADSCQQALRTGERATVPLMERPALYNK